MYCYVQYSQNSCFFLSFKFMNTNKQFPKIEGPRLQKKSRQLKIWTKNTNSRAITQSKIIRPKRNSNLNCNSSRYSHIPNIKSIYQRTSRKSPDNVKFEQKIQVELQFKLEFCSGRIIFGWVMALELVFFVQIWS
jgi:hypothetical protein